MTAGAADLAGGADVTVTDRSTGGLLVTDETKRDSRSGIFSIEPAEARDAS